MCARPSRAVAPPSRRGQLLGRTVKGMMCYERAVRMLLQLEYPRPEEVDEAEYQVSAYGQG